MGRALVRRPRLFLLDEPLSNLDARLRISVRLELKRLHQQMKATILYVTHDQVEAMTMGDRIVVMNAGVIQQVGSPLELYNKPRNLFVAGFIGSPTMNFLPCRIVEEQDRDFIDTNSFRLLLTDAMKTKIRETGREKFVFGVRSEDISIADEEQEVPELKQTFRAQVNVVETLLAEHLGILAWLANICLNNLPEYLQKLNMLQNLDIEILLSIKMIQYSL